MSNAQRQRNLKMAKLIIVSAIVLFIYVLTCSATVYTVGDNSGWDISTDLDTWQRDKTFTTNDTLYFTYSQYHSVNEVTKENYDVCNTTNDLSSNRNGNATFPLSNIGDRYFVCGNRLHCLGGMKLHVHVLDQNQSTGSPVGAPQAQPGGNLPTASSSSRRDNPSSSSSILNRVKIESLLVTVFGSLVVLFSDVNMRFK